MSLLQFLKRLIPGRSKPILNPAPQPQPEPVSKPAGPPVFNCDMCSRDFFNQPVLHTAPGENGSDVTSKLCGACHDTMGAVLFHKLCGYPGRRQGAGSTE